MIEDIGGDHQLVGPGAGDERVEPLSDRVGAADDRGAERVIDHRAPVRIEAGLEIRDRRRHLG